MSAVWMRVRAEVRSSWRATIGMALVIGITGAVVMAAAAGARRIERVYPEFRRAQNTAQLGIASNEGAPFGFAAVDLASISRYPEVTDWAPFSFLIAFARTEDGLELTPVADRNPVVFFTGADGKFNTVLNRMHILEGQFPDPDEVEEVAVSYMAAQEYGLEVGERLTLHLPTFADFATVPDPSVDPLPTGPTIDARIVAIEATSWELPPGTGYPPIHLSPAFYRAYGSTTPHFPAAVYTLRSDDDFRAVVERAQRDAVRPTRANPSTRIQVFDELLNAHAIRAGVHLEVLALWLLAGLAGLTSALVIGQAVVRQATLDAATLDAFRAIGMTRRQRAGSTAVRFALVAGAGSGVAAVIAIALSPLMPIGVARLVDLHPGGSIDWPILAFGVLAIVTVVLAASMAGTRAPTLGDDPEAGASAIARALGRTSMPATAMAGTRMALQRRRGRSAVPVRSTMVGVVAAVASIVAGMGFGASMQHLLDTPRVLGWNWSGSIGDDFDPDGTTTVLPVLRQIPGIGALAGGGAGTVQVGDATFDVVGQDSFIGRIGPLMLEGTEPSGPDEIALGTRTMRAVRTSIGDVIAVRNGPREQRMRVVGRAVIPPLIPQDAAGVGGWMTFEALRRLQVDVARDIFLFRVAAGADEQATFRAIKQAIPSLSLTTQPVYGDQANLERIINLPVLLAGMLALFGLASLTHTLLQATRRARRDLAIFKALGFSRAQLHGVVRWHASVLIVVALAIGIPVGIVASRWSWGVFAGTAGFAFEPALPVAAVGLLVPAAVALGMVISAIPGTAAARTKPALVLRSE